MLEEKGSAGRDGTGRVRKVDVASCEGVGIWGRREEDGAVRGWVEEGEEVGEDVGEEGVLHSREVGGVLHC